MGKFTEQLNAELTKNYSDYQRALYQTYFTAPEWRNVEMADEFAKFLATGKPFYQFPFFRQLQTFWQVFKKSYQTSRQHHGFWELMLSEYMLMNLFIGINITLEFILKGTLSLLLSPFLKSNNHTEFQRHVAELYAAYGQFIHKTPFFNFPYQSNIYPLWQSFKNSQTKSFADYLTLIMVMTEWTARMIISFPVAWWYNQPQHAASESIHLIIKSKKTRLDIEALHPKLEFIGNSLQKNSNSADRYYHIRAPRYEQFQKVIELLIENKIKIKKIAGQQSIQFKLEAETNQLAELPKANLLFSYQNHIDSGKHFVLFDARCNDMAQTIEQLKEKQIPIKLMHDF